MKMDTYGDGPHNDGYIHMLINVRGVVAGGEEDALAELLGMENGLDPNLGEVVEIWVDFRERNNVDHDIQPGPHAGGFYRFNADDLLNRDFDLLLENFSRQDGQLVNFVLNWMREELNQEINDDNHDDIQHALHAAGDGNIPFLDFAIFLEDENQQFNNNIDFLNFRGFLEDENQQFIDLWDNGNIGFPDIIEIQDDEHQEIHVDIGFPDINEIQDDEHREIHGGIGFPDINEIQDDEHQEIHVDIGFPDINEIQDDEHREIHGGIGFPDIIEILDDEHREIHGGIGSPDHDYLDGVVEDHPQPGASRKRSREEDEEDDEERRSKRRRRWNKFIDDSSDTYSDSDSDSTNCDDFNRRTGISHINCAEVAEEDPLPGPSRKRSREEDEEDDEERRSKRRRRWNKFIHDRSDSDSDSTNCDDFNRKTGISHINCAEVAEEDPLPGPSRKRSREEDEEDDEERRRKRRRRWNKVIDDRSDTDIASDSTNCDDFNRRTGISHINCAEVAEQDPLPGPSRKRSREEDEEDDGGRSSKCHRGWKKFINDSSDTDSDSDSTNCDDFNRKTGISHITCAEVAEDPLPGSSRKRLRKTDRADSSSEEEEEEEEENPRPKTSRKRSRQDDEDEDARGSKQLKRKRKRR